MKIKRRSRWLILIVLLYCLWAVGPVSAHAVLLQSNPQANAVLARSPVQVELFFSEPLEPKLSFITVIDINNRTVDAGDVRVDPADPKRMTVTLHTPADGVYTVSWRALSTIDGHQTVGTFPFAVGDTNAMAVQSLQQTATARLPFTALLAKFLLLASLAILVGQRLFNALVWEPALNPDRVAHPEIWITLYRIGLIGVLLGIGIGMLSQAGQAAGAELSFPWDLQMGRILTESRLGSIWLFRLVLGILAVWLFRDTETTFKNWIGLAVNLLLLFTVTLTSHAATEAQPFLPVLGDWLHLVGMTFWFGGLVHLFVGMRILQELDDQQRISAISRLTARFSVIALLFVALLGVTGIYSAYLRVGSWSAALTSLYGHVLLIKQVFVAGLLVIAGMNFLVISPRLKRASREGSTGISITGRFGTLLTLEITLAVLLLGSVSFLTYLPPARVVSASPELTERTQVDDLNMEISISPGRVGQNTFALKLSLSQGHPVHTAKEVLLRFTPAETNLAPSDLELIGSGDGMFTAQGANLSLPGKWQIRAVVRREGMFDAYGNFDFNLRDPASNGQASVLSKQTGILLLLMGALYGLLAYSAKSKFRWSMAAGVPIVLWMAAAGFYFLFRPVDVQEAQINPIPPNSESISAGQNLYNMNCLLCHGVSGLGDGPVGLTLNPRPADLRQHAIVGIHTDAQLFEWITNGFPGSQMPPFKSTLSDTDRWHLVNFIRTLTPE